MVSGAHGFAKYRNVAANLGFQLCLLQQWLLSLLGESVIINVIVTFGSLFAGAFSSLAGSAQVRNVNDVLSGLY